MSDNSRDKLRIGLFRKSDGSQWVYVDLLKWGAPYPRIVPAFHDLHRIIRAMAHCEDVKYPPPAKGRTRLAEFLCDAVYERDFQLLAAKYNIPERDGDVIVNANGARLSPHAETPLNTTTPTQRPGDLFTAADIRWESR